MCMVHYVVASSHSLLTGIPSCVRCIMSCFITGIPSCVVHVVASSNWYTMCMVHYVVASSNCTCVWCIMSLLHLTGIPSCVWHIMSLLQSNWYTFVCYLVNKLWSEDIFWIWILLRLLFNLFVVVFRRIVVILLVLYSSCYIVVSFAWNTCFFRKKIQIMDKHWGTPLWNTFVSMHNLYIVLLIVHQSTLLYIKYSLYIVLFPL